MAEAGDGRRGPGRTAMTPAERDAFLEAAPVCRVATVGAEGHPHVSPLWFVWDGVHLWLNSLVRSRRWVQAGRDPRAAVVVDDGGADFLSLRGVELRGRLVVVGEAPRRGEPLAELEEPERRFAAKYAGGRPFSHDGRHGWLRLDVDHESTWDYAKLRPAREG